MVISFGPLLAAESLLGATAMLGAVLLFTVSPSALLWPFSAMLCCLVFAGLSSPRHCWDNDCPDVPRPLQRTPTLSLNLPFILFAVGVQRGRLFVCSPCL